jgi:hypothetical protein
VLLADGGAVFGADPLGDRVDEMVEAVDRALEGGDLGHLGVLDLDLGRVAGAGGGESRSRQGERDDQGRENMCAFYEQARDRGGLCPFAG